MLARKDILRVFLLLSVTFLLFAPLPSGTLWWREAIDSGHILVFLFYPFLFIPWLKEKRPDVVNASAYLIALLTGLLLGALVEGVQVYVDREASLHDMLGNLFGITAGLLLYMAINTRFVVGRRLMKVMLMLGAFGVIGYGLSPLIRLSLHYVERAEAFPVVMDLKTDWAQSFIRYDTGQYPGLTIIEPEADWAAYHSLRFSISSSSQRETKLVIRIHDRAHNQELSDRFNRRLSVKPGLNEFSIALEDVRDGPAQRLLDLQHIAGLTLFTGALEDWTPLTIGPVVLQ